MALHKLLPGVRSIRASVGGGRVRLYAVPSLAECRAAMASALQTDLRWDTDRPFVRPGLDAAK